MYHDFMLTIELLRYAGGWASTKKRASWQFLSTVSMEPAREILFLSLYFLFKCIASLKRNL